MTKILTQPINQNGASSHEAPPFPTPDPDEMAWSYRGYKMRGGEFNTAMVHLYRGEITRSNVWRTRLDATTNWAVIVTGAAISVSFADGTGKHGAIILSTLLITIFLFLEARRYRYYELWSKRVRLLETDFYAAMLVPPFRPANDWAESLAESLLQPSFPISMLEAFGRRFRRNYVWLYLVLALAWLMQVWLHPTAPTSGTEFVERAAIGDIPGWLILLAGFVFNGTLLLIGLLTSGLRQASGEVLPRYNFALPGLLDFDPTKPPAFHRQAWFRPSARRQQLIVHIITDHAQTVSERILTEMRRGVTALSGTGMYTGKAHSVLMCVLTVTEVAQLKTLVSAVDPHAFVTISPAQEVLGSGFAALREV
ncbi:MAG: hypothetical protein DPW09_17255 [Anaerolineae bacterium]|nr:hypothetical protein [Anaerolineae bacterium]